MKSALQLTKPPHGPVRELKHGNRSNTDSCRYSPCGHRSSIHTGRAYRPITWRHRNPREEFSLLLPRDDLYSCERYTVVDYVVFKTLSAGSLPALNRKPASASLFRS